MSETFSIGVMPFAFMPRKDNTAFKVASPFNPWSSLVSSFEQTELASEF